MSKYIVTAEFVDFRKNKVFKKDYLFNVSTWLLKTPVEEAISSELKKKFKNFHKVTEIKEIESHYNRGYKFNRIKFITSNGNSWLFCEMDCNKRHWFIV